MTPSIQVHLMDLCRLRALEANQAYQIVNTSSRFSFGFLQFFLVLPWASDWLAPL